MSQLPIERFWINDPAVLYQNGNFYKIIPISSMSTVQQLNALTRLFIYLLIIFLIIPATRKYYYLPIIAILVVIIYYYVWKNSLHKQGFDNIVKNNDTNVQNNDTNVQDNDREEICQKPTVDNPFMNITFADSMDNVNRPKACYNDETMKTNFYKNIPYDTDTYNVENSYRTFYTMPSTTIPNDQTTFAKLLYGSPATCKENPLNCLRYEDVRYNRYNPTTDSPSNE